jgi:hypothetical protein
VNAFAADTNVVAVSREALVLLGDRELQRDPRARARPARWFRRLPLGLIV